MSVALTEHAERDIRDIIRDTLKMFGPNQVHAYGLIIDKGIATVAEEPDRIGSIDRSEIAPSVRILHLELAAGRRGGAAHCLYYATGRLPDGWTGTMILRILHEHMEPRHRVVRTLKTFRWGSGDSYSGREQEIGEDPKAS